ncbi:hypothetical protein KCP73_11670 [Salmonella enterica subsp. enterica]|nr:hypothetical protein KCP73_11670 [Salmonella enterica subsp. enterica]
MTEAAAAEQTAGARQDRRSGWRASFRPSTRLDYAGFDRVDVVVEAVVENWKVKKRHWRKPSRKCARKPCWPQIPTIPIGELAASAALERPENFCGMHFFNPVHRMPLVEIIRGEKSSDETIASRRLGRKMGKTPIVVNDRPGFFVNRVLFPYFRRFPVNCRDGAGFRKVDKVMEKQSGWAGPAYLLMLFAAGIPRITRRR